MAYTGSWTAKNTVYTDPQRPQSYPLDPEHAFVSYGLFKRPGRQPVPVEAPPTWELDTDPVYPANTGGWQLPVDQVHAVAVVDNEQSGYAELAPSPVHGIDLGGPYARLRVVAPEFPPSDTTATDTPAQVMPFAEQTWQRGTRNSLPANNPEPWRPGFYRSWNYDRLMNAVPVGWRTQPHALHTAGPTVPGEGNEVYLPARAQNSWRPALYREPRPWDDTEVTDGTDAVSSDDDFTEYW
jgi:hypothetical protein